MMLPPENGQNRTAKLRIRLPAAWLLPWLILFCLAGAGCSSGGGGDGDDPGGQAEYILSGTIRAAANTAVDSDVNDPNARYAANDTAASAQELYSPITLGGYVNQPESGSTGRSRGGGDQSDVFRIRLLAGETIVLAIAEPFNQVFGEPDLDVFLYDAASLELLDAGLETSARIESLTAPADNTYLLQVAAVSGASNYALVIGRRAGTQNSQGLRLSSAFVPGEVIARLSGSARAQASEKDLLQTAGLQHKAGAPGRSQLFALSGIAEQGHSLQSGAPETFYDILLDGASMDEATREKLSTLLQIKQLQGRAGVMYAEPNYLRTASWIPDDTYYNIQWHYPLIHLPAAWDTTRGSPDVTVAVIDSGILSSHPDIGANIDPNGYDFISDAHRAMDGDGIDPDPGDPGDGSLGGSLFHGTHVAGTIAAKTNNTTGVAGVAPNTRILPLRALGREGTGTTYDILQAVRYAAGLENDSGRILQSPADIFNLSFGSQTFSQAEQDVYAQARSRGVILISSAGNSAQDMPFYPADYEGVVSVSAVDINSDLAPYSNFGPFVDVAAPGGNLGVDLNADGYVDGILSTGGDDSSGAIQYVYRFLQGTSMAAPHVAGVAALMKGLRPSMTPAEFDAFLQSGAISRDIGASGRDDLFGHGLIDAEKAILTARDGTVPTMINVSPVRIGFGVFLDTAALNVSRTGTDPLTVTDVFAGDAWLYVAETDTDENGFGTYAVTVRRQGLSAGTYESEITFISSRNTVAVPVSMEVNPDGDMPDAGFHYILLINHETGKPMHQVSASEENGLYEYRFTGVAHGNYRIYAGSDSDNDNLLGDPGEAFGAYLTTDQPHVVVADKDLSGLDFSTDFRVNLSHQETAADTDPAVPLRRLNPQPLKKISRK